MYKKLVASLMTALMAALTLASPALAATALNTYPTFLGKSGDFYVVVGENAATIDVVGAVDIASNLAQLSYKETTTEAAAALTGTERKVVIPTSATGGQIFGADANTFPAPLRTYHFSGLKEGQYSFKGTTHNYHEEVRNATTIVPQMTHSLIDYVNGTLKMKIDTNAIEYRYVFDSTIAAADWDYSTANATTYETPLEVNLMGESLKIVAIPSTTSFKALSGKVGWIAEGSSGLTVDDLSVQVDTVYSSTQASIKIVDAAGNVVNNIGVITTATTPPSFTYQGKTYKVKLLSAAAATVAGKISQAQLVFGRDDVEKTFDGGDLSTITAFGSAWKIGGNFATAGRVQSGDYVKVTYSASAVAEVDKYYKAGDVFKGPSDYFELSYQGTYPSKFAKVTIERVTGQSIYNSTVDTSTAATNLNGLKISTDVAGTLTFNNVGYDEVYVLFQATPTTANTWNTSNAYIGYKDKTTGKIISFSNATWPKNLYDTGTGKMNAFNYTVSYGGPGASATFVLNGTFSNRTIFGGGIGLYTTGTVQQVNMTFQNRTASTSDIMLGPTTGTAEADDVIARVEGSSAVTAEKIGLQLSDVITDGGVWVYSVKSNAASDKVVLGVAAETVYAVVQFGKIGPAAAAAVVKEVVPITTAVAKLDSEITATDKTTKNLVLVGGPCANALVQALVDAGKIGANYTCAGKVPGAAWTANTGYIMVVDDAFATGKYVVVVAGTMGVDTRLASTVLQQYATKLKDITASTAKITGTAIATATIAAA